MKIIVGDGEGRKVQILTEDGTDLTNLLHVESLDLNITATKLKVTLGLYVSQLVLEDPFPDVQWKTKNPITGEVGDLKTIEFEDGTRVRFRPNGEVEQEEEDVDLSKELGED